MQPIAHDDALRRRVAANLAAQRVRTHALDGRRHAAVAVLLLDSDAERHGHDDADLRGVDLADIPDRTDDVTGSVHGTAGGAAVLLTRRGAHLDAHARQWAFPGGSLDDGESPLEAAVRETAEEVGVALSEDDCLGRLDDYPTRSGYVISPFVFWVPDEVEPVANPGEVASIHRIALAEVCREDSPRFVEIPESERPVVQMAIGADLIHAPTGAILYQLREVGLRGRDLRVDHLEQPVFAWR